MKLKVHRYRPMLTNFKRNLGSEKSSRSRRRRIPPSSANSAPVSGVKVKIQDYLHAVDSSGSRLRRHEEDECKGDGICKEKRNKAGRKNKGKGGGKHGKARTAGSRGTRVKATAASRVGSRPARRASSKATAETAANGDFLSVSVGRSR